MYPFIAPYPKEACQRSLGVEEAWPTPRAQGSGRPAGGVPPTEEHGWVPGAGPQSAVGCPREAGGQR